MNNRYDRFHNRLEDGDTVNVRHGYVVLNLIISLIIVLILGFTVMIEPDEHPVSVIILVITVAQFVFHGAVVFLQDYLHWQRRRLRRKIKQPALFDYRYDPALDKDAGAVSKRTFLGDDGEIVLSVPEQGDHPQGA